MSRFAHLIALATVALLATIAAIPASAADQGGLQVVEAGTALFPDRAYVLTLPKPRSSALTTDDVKVTEDGKPVKNLSVLSVRLGGGHRHRASDRLVEQHEGVDQLGDAGGADLRCPEPGPAALDRVLQLESRPSHCP